jgi:hemolysin activation/secretion protein
MNKTPAAKALLAALLAALPPLSAQAAGPVAPNAGSILKQIEPVTPPSPSPSGTGLTIERGSGGKPPPSAPFLVRTVRISGNSLFDTAVLHALVAEAEGKSLTLSQLGELVARITDYYHSRGYPLAQAIIPAQVARDGVVAVVVIEARYGKITLNNHSRVNDRLLQDTLSPLQSGRAIGQAELDHALLLLSDIPGVALNATLKPGETVGTSDLLVDAAAGPAVSGDLVLDGYGNRYIGRARIGGTVNVIDPLHHGDVLSVSGLSSGSGVNYGRIAYETLLNGPGARMGGAYSALHYVLGGPVASLHAHGDAQVESLWAKHPLVRSRDINLYGQLQYDWLQLRDHIDAGAIRTDRRLEKWTVSLAGDGRDALLSGGVNTWSLGWTAGRVGFDNGSAQLADAATARTRGGFSKWTVSLSRLQRLSPKNGLYLAFSGQWANANLDPSEKMIAGGPYTVRAYDIGAVSGDTGYQGTAELRRDLGAAWHGQWQAVAFIDSAHVTVNKTVWVAGANSATLNGAGVGLNWAGPNRWSARTYVAAPIGSAPGLVVSTASARAGAEISVGF